MHRTKQQPGNDEKDRGRGISVSLSRILYVGACIINPEETLKNSVDRPTRAREVTTDYESCKLQRLSSCEFFREAMIGNVWVCAG